MLNDVIESHRGDIYRAHARDEQLRQDQLLQEQPSEQHRELHEAREKSLHEMEEIEAISRVYIRYIFKERGLIED